MRRSSFGLGLEIFCLRNFNALILMFRMSGSTVVCENVFKGEWDRFRGVSVSSDKEPRTEVEFPQTLQCSITQWKENKVRAVWMKVYLEHSYWIPTLVGNGFNYHHAKPNYVTMVKWLPEDEPNNIPCFAHNNIGVGGFVVNEAEELLVVRERFQKVPDWKIPGGYVELGEDFTVTAIREVKEETGIDTEFDSLLAFRHMHNANFGCSDLYLIVVLKPKSRVVTMCKNELADCQWMKLKDYLQHPHVNEMNKFFGKCYLEGKAKGVHIKSLKKKFQKFQQRNPPKDQVVYFIEASGPSSGMSNSGNGSSSSKTEESSHTSSI